MILATGEPDFKIDAKDGDLVRQADGSYLLVWISGEAIIGQVFEESGSPSGEAFNIHTGAGGPNLGDVSAAVIPGPNNINLTVLTWMENGSIKSLFLKDQSPVMPAQTLEIDGLSSKTSPEVRLLDDGSIAVLYQGIRQEDQKPWYGLYIRPIEGEPQNVLLSPVDVHHAATVTSDSWSVLIYVNESSGDLQVESTRGLEGHFSGIERISSDPENAHPSVTALSDGRFMVTWQDHRSATDSTHVVRAQLFNATHTATDGVITFAKPPGAIVHTTVAQLADGSFAVALTMDENGDKNVYVMTCSGGGIVTDPVFVGRSTAGDQTDPSIIPLDGITFVIGWNDHVEGRGSQYMTEIFAGSQEPANTAPTNIRLTSGNGSAADIAEDRAAGAPVAKVTADDNGPAGELRYVLADNAAFAIDAVTGAITVKAGARLDYETTKTYALQVTVKDLNGAGLSATRTITVNVTDVVDVVNGTSGKNVLVGASGADRVNGLYGNDTLTGGGGTDVFIFDSKLGSFKTDRKVNFDKITDFSVRDDTIWLDNKIFKKLGKGTEANPGKLNKSFFVVGDKAKDKDDTLIYNKKTGVLSYDADGSGKGQAVEFAQFSKNPALKSTDFLII